MRSAGERESRRDGWDCDVRICLQSPLLSNFKSGFSRPIFWLGEVNKDMDQQWAEGASTLGMPGPDKILRGRSYPRRMNTSGISVFAKRRICHIRVVDFCCLNFPFPPECLPEALGEGHEALGCRWDTDPGSSDKRPAHIDKFIVPVGKSTKH